MTKHIIQFKDPDLIYEIARAQVSYPDDEGDITPNMERTREDFMAMYFEYGDYGWIEIDSETLECRLLTRAEGNRK